MSSVERRAAPKAAHGKTKKAPVRAAARKAAVEGEIIKGLQLLRKDVKHLRDRLTELDANQADLRVRLRKTDGTAEGEASAAPSPADRRREAVKRYRDEMRRQGMKLIQFWVPDVSAPGFVDECRRQSLLASGNPGEGEVLGDLEANHAAALADEPDFDWGAKGSPK